MRLAKYLAQAGVSSRRGAEVIIRQGRVQINGLVVDQPQAAVTESDSVAVDGKPVEGPEKKLYVLLNKPPGYISTVSDTHNRPTVMDLVKDIRARLYPVGRLDADTSGILLLTNDGELAHRLTHPRYQVEKVYHVWVTGCPKSTTLNLMEKGVAVDGQKTAPASVRVLKVSDKKNYALLEITLTEGKKRQVKKMCEAVNHPLTRLHRKKFAGLDTGALPEGSYRYLTEKEVKKLYSLVSL